MPETQPASTNSTCVNAPGRGGPGLTSPALGTRDGHRAHGGWPPSQHILRAPWNLAWVASALGLAERGVVAGGRGDRRGGASACAPLGATFAGARNVTGRHGASRGGTGRHRASQDVTRRQGRHGAAGAARGVTGRHTRGCDSGFCADTSRATRGGPDGPSERRSRQGWGRRGPGRMSGCSRRKQRADGRRVTSPRKADAAPRSRALHSRLLDAGPDLPGSPGPRRPDPARGVRSPPTHASKHDPQAQGQRPTRKQTGLRLTLTDLELTFKLLGDQKNKIFILNLSRLMR